jgi:hypothetical protein
MIADDTPVSGQHFWPWVEQPYKLWSLWEMLRFYAGTFVTVVMELLQARDFLNAQLTLGAPGDALGELRKAVGHLQDEFSRFPLSPSLQRQTARMLKMMDDGQPPERLFAISGEILANLQVELLEWLFFCVPPDRRVFYQNPKAWFGENVTAVFPDSGDDLEAAGRCFTFGEWTACVFHLMRATEGALHRWAGQLGIALKVALPEANWQEILNGADAKLREIGQLPRTDQRTADLEYFGETSAQFRSIKDAWRNHVSHGKRTYDEQRASEIMQHVRAFMLKLASRK